MGVTMVWETPMDTMGTKTTGVTMVQGVPMGTMGIMQKETTITFLHKLALGPPVEIFLDLLCLSS
jgi:hypothetical protein